MVSHAMKMNGICILCSVLLSTQTITSAATMDVTLIQTGGFYADGSLDNDPTFQNYFIGYSTTTPFPRTPERRHFFVFDLTGVTIPIVSAEFSVILPFGGLIADEPSETWVATGTGVGAAMYMDTGLTPAEAIPIFLEMGAAPGIIDPVMFGPGDDDGLEKTFALNALGISFLNAHLGSLVPITGFMPSWSEEPEIDESSEIIFGHTNVVASGPALIDPPVLTITTIPEPSGFMLLGMGAIVAAARRRK